ncbi:deoxyguanosinetriphosphate triphosphohydrolase [Arcanobacterium hippocoleae]|uniref:Deoxyguanosinetriphosphate triphosphohydrolase-like protein n=1 Tax=Arcanobacterium hippocoleae TaxID=149017 RepID=A0ABU1T0X3_9ACTO|nr:deoxyguanosinetriphosphate triphosphohydrolase [Arcanobacterium hippocoleae]MDR6938983.1 dGTPase [Arcanobacterium hippocoleae]
MSYQDGYTSEDRQRFVDEGEKNASRTDFERDRARVLHSAALRRLGAKTQVLGPEQDDFIRTRLTHSLEVAQVGRSLAKNLGADPDIVETACLAHDIGHPPFGHNGEYALDELAQACGGFEGNAQTLRVLSKLEQKRFAPNGEPVGLNLTRATLDAVLKYPWRRGAGPTEKNVKKFGAYEDDAHLFHWAHLERGTTRCIEAQIMDFSDDIAYSVHDVEDTIVHHALNSLKFADIFTAVNSTHLRDAIISATMHWYPGNDANALEDAFERITQMEAWPNSFTGSSRDLAQLKDFTSDLIGRFIFDITEATTAEYGDGNLTRYHASIVMPSATKYEILLLKGLAVYFVMEPRESEPVYYDQRTILFDLYDVIMESPTTRLEPVFSDFWRRAEDEAQKQRVVIDQIASLTDQSARAWHARYCGMLRN